jgi:sporulation integral membrane protein YlbJ
MNYLKKYKNKLTKGFILIFLAVMILYPVAAFQGASTGLLLWFHNVLPNLLPFIIISNLMIRLNITKQLSKLFYPILGRIFHVSTEGCYPIVLGFLSGIPMGAKSTADLVADKKIHMEEAQFLFTMCNNASPMFILGYIAISQLKLPHIKYALFVILYSSAIISAVLYRFLQRQVIRKHSDHSSSVVKEDDIPQQKSHSFSFDLLDNSIMNGFEVVTKIGGYIILFSILAQILKEACPGSGIMKAFLMGLLEITTGISQVCNTSMNDSIKIVLVAVLTSFGGLSGLAQTRSVLGDTRLSMKSYFIVKLINGVVALLITYLYVTFNQIV